MDGVGLRIEDMVRSGGKDEKSRVFAITGQGVMARSFGKCNDPIFVDIQKIIPIHLASIASAIHLWVSLW